MTLRPILLAVAAAGLAACAAIPASKEFQLENTLNSYAGVIRWGNFEEAASFINPEVLHAHPLSDLDVERYHQVRVTVYSEGPPRYVNDTEVHQTVEIGIVNNNTQAARSVIDNQVWHYDAKEKRWWLMSGLPNITGH